MKKPIRVIMSIICLSAYTLGHGQIITNVAGTSVSGYSGDGNAATSAQLNHPNGVAVDAMGNIYFSDYYNHVIRKVNTLGVISTFAGNTVAGYSGDGNAATSAKLNFPTGVAVDGLGNVYIADKNNSVIRKVNTSGIISTFAGNNVNGYSGDGNSATSAKLHFPATVAVDGLGNVYIGDTYNHAVRKVNTSGIISTLAGNTTIGYSGDGGSATSAQLNYPWGVTVDSSGNVYIADEHNDVVRKVNTSGIISTIAGTGTAGYSGDGSNATSAKLNVPNGVVLDTAGNIYISDISNNVIRKINTSGIISTIAGTGVAGFSGNGGLAISAQLDGPSSITLDNLGNVLFTDGNNHSVRKIHTGITSINAVENKKSINVYPNPANDHVTIDFGNYPVMAGYSLKINNTIGQTVFAAPVNQQQSVIDLSGWDKNGMYFIQIIDAKNNTIETRKLSIQ